MANTFSPTISFAVERTLDDESNSFSSIATFEVQQIVSDNSFSQVFYLTSPDVKSNVEFDVEATSQIEFGRTLDSDIELDVETDAQITFGRTSNADIEFDVEATVVKVIQKTVDTIIEFDSNSNGFTALEPFLDADLELDVESTGILDHSETLQNDLEFDVETDAQITKEATSEVEIEFDVETTGFVSAGNIYMKSVEVGIEFNNDVFYARKIGPLFETGQRGNIRIVNLSTKNISLGRKQKSTLVLAPSESSLQKQTDFDLAQLSNLSDAGLIQVFGINVRNL